jgi:hypothetical protein
MSKPQHTTIIVHTSASRAVRHACQHGWHRIDVGPQDLTPQQRDWLADNVIESEGARLPEAFDVAPPTLEGLRTAIDAALAAYAKDIELMRAEQDRAQAEVQRHEAEIDRVFARELEKARTCPIGELVSTGSGQAATGAPLTQAYCRAAERAGLAGNTWVDLTGRGAELAEFVAQREAALEATRAEGEATIRRNRAVLLAWLRESDQPEAAERAEEGLLPMSELEDLADAHLFRRVLPWGELDHADRFPVRCEGLTSGQYHALKRLRVLADNVPGMTVHEGQWTTDSEEPLAWALVTISRFGYDFDRFVPLGE